MIPDCELKYIEKVMMPTLTKQLAQSIKILYENKKISDDNYGILGDKLRDIELIMENPHI